jgi:hypothetical protein
MRIVPLATNTRWAIPAQPSIVFGAELCRKAKKATIAAKCSRRLDGFRRVIGDRAMNMTCPQGAALDAFVLQKMNDRDLSRVFSGARPTRF